MLASAASFHASLARPAAAKNSHQLRSKLRPSTQTRVSYATSSDSLSKIQADILRHNANIPARLGKLKPHPGSKKPERRIGRGIGSGRGKTSTKGHKGRTARQGGEVAFGFEGGQTPFYKRMRKFGFTNKYHQRKYSPVNLARLQFWIDTGRIDSTQTITMKTLLDSNCVGKLRRQQKGIKLLGEGGDWFKTPINIEVSQASESAMKAVQSAGGSVKLVYYNDTGLRAMLKPEKYYPHTDRPLPYLTIPRAKVNKRLLQPMEQPEQFPGWVEAQTALKEAITAASGSGSTTNGTAPL